MERYPTEIRVKSIRISLRWESLPNSTIRARLDWRKHEKGGQTMPIIRSDEDRRKCIRWGRGEARVLVSPEARRSLQPRDAAAFLRAGEMVAPYGATVERSCMEWTEIQAALKDTGLNLIDALADSRASRDLRRVAFNDAAEHLLVHMKTGDRASGVKAALCCLTVPMAEFGHLSLTDVTREMLVWMLGSRKISPQTWNDY